MGDAELFDPLRLRFIDEVAHEEKHPKKYPAKHVPSSLGPLWIIFGRSNWFCPVVARRNMTRRANGNRFASVQGQWTSAKFKHSPSQRCESIASCLIVIAVA
jgi:hypothetical protein